MAKQFRSSGFVGLKFDFGGWTDDFEFWSANPSKCLGVCYITVFNQTLISNCIYNKINIIAANISIIWESLKTSNQLAKFLRHIAGHLTTLLKFFFKTVFIFSRVRSHQYLLQVAWRSSRDVINVVVYMSAFRIFLHITSYTSALTKLEIGVHVHLL